MEPIVREEEKISSAYASAESSPNTSLKASLSFTHNKQQQPMSTSRSSHELLEEYLLNGNTNSLVEFQSLPPNLQSDENKTNVNQLIIKKISDLVPKRVTSINGTAVSSSSPNPESNPFKLLAPIVPTTTVTVTSSDNQDQTSNNVDNNKSQIIENLALLSHNEHEKADPILSSSSSKSPNDNASSETIKNDKCIMHLSPSKSTSSMILPASSQEFCMDLNLNIAAAVVNANGTSIAITSSSSTNSLSDHNRFTSNASTSSIHNDLKMILEESKENKTIDSTSPQSTNDAKRGDDKSNKSSPNTSIDQSNENSNGQSTMINSQSSTNLINLMMLMVNNKTSFNNLQAKLTQTTQQMNTSQEQQNIDEQQQKQEEKMNDVNDKIKHDGHYRYNRDFLNQVRKQRAELIETIYPEIFKVYSYCTTGKHWDPEKYFDIVQYSGDYDKIEEQHQQQNSARNKNRYQSKTQPQQQQQSSTKKKSYNNNRNHNHKLYNNNQIDHSIDSPQLQVPKNSPKSNIDEQNQQTLSSSNDKNQIDIMSLLMNKTKNEQQVDKKTEADRHLLNMLKVNKQQKNDADLNNNNEKNNIMDLLTNKQNNVQPTQTGINIINNLFKPQQQQQQTSAITKPATNNNAHYPLILTAQELEMLQLKSEESRKNEKNNSDAYKQLVMNLNNHPLNTSSKDNNVLNKLQNKPTQILDNVLSMLTTTTNQSNKTVNNNNNDNEGTAILKQLLNLDANNASLNDSPDKKSKSAYNNKKVHHHNHHNNHRQNKHKPQSSYSNDNPNFSFAGQTQVSNTPFNKVKSSPNKYHKNKKSDNFVKKQSHIQPTENQHFTSLISKIIPTIHQQSTITPTHNEKDNIMKWFTDVQLQATNLVQNC